jgi:formate/nitrite transporter FocA (FNT family)
MGTFSYNSYSPSETIELVSRAGVKKGLMRPDKVFLSSVSAGCLLAFASASSLSTNTAPWFQENAPGLIRTIGALIFPYGLVLIVLTGADLCTGTFMVRNGKSDLVGVFGRSTEHVCVCVYVCA